MRTVALIVAAGRGERFGAGQPKQYAGLAGRPVLRHAVQAFRWHPAVDGVAVVIGAGDEAAYGDAVAGLDLLPPATGGRSRQESVRLGLESLAALGPDRVLIHDAARPLVSAALIARSILLTAGHCVHQGGSLPGRSKDKGWIRSAVYTPAYRNGAAP